MENNKNKKSMKFQGDMLNFCDFIQVFVFTPNHHLNGKNKKKIYFFFQKIPKIFHLVLKISAISLVLRTREITDIFNTFNEIYLVFTSKK